MWKDIDNFNGLYQVSDSGLVKSVCRHIENGSKSGMTLNEKVLKCSINNKNGYAYVTLRKDGKSFAFSVHRLVADAFLDNHDNKKVVNHIDGNKLNNCVTNLEYVTYSENNQHAYDTGLKSKGEDFYNAKLSYSDVIEIRKEYPSLNLNQLSKKYNVSRGTIRDVVNNITWKT